MIAKLDQHALERLRAQDRADCPIAYLSVKERPGQRPFFYDPAMVCFNVGGKKSGKSFVTVGRASEALTGIEPLELPGTLALLPKPPVRIRHWCIDILRTVPKVLLPLYLAHIPRVMLNERNGVNGYNRATATLELTNGSWVQFMSYGMEEGKGESAELDIVIFDEPPPYNLFKSQHLRIVTSRGRAYLWGGMTLDAQRTRWPIWWVEKEILRNPDKKHVSHHVLLTEENVRAIAKEVGGAEGAVMMDRLEYIKTALPADEIAMALQGKGGWLQGVVYKEFDEKLHTYQPKLQPNDFLNLARKGYGRVWCGMDFGGSHPTVCVYTFVCSTAVPDLQLLEGDYVQFGEYFKQGGNAPRHIAKMKPIHERIRPAGYVCDTQMWDRDAGGGPRVSDMFRQAGIRPLYKAHKPVNAGVERVNELLMCRPAPYGWPRYRLLPGKRNEHTLDGFKGWQYHPNANNLSGKDRYSEYNKDQMDAVRYLCMRCVERDHTGPIVQMPLDPITGLPLSLTVPGAWVHATR